MRDALRRIMEIDVSQEYGTEVDCAQGSRCRKLAQRTTLHTCWAKNSLAADGVLGRRGLFTLLPHNSASGTSASGTSPPLHQESRSSAFGAADANQLQRRRCDSFHQKNIHETARAAVVLSMTFLSGVLQLSRLLARSSAVRATQGVGVANHAAFCVLSAR